MSHPRARAALAHLLFDLKLDIHQVINLLCVGFLENIVLLSHFGLVLVAKKSIFCTQIGHHFALPVKLPLGVLFVDSRLVF